MNVDEFRQFLLNETGAWAESDRNFTHSAFVDVAVGYLEEAGEVSDFKPCYYRGIGLRRRALAIDGYAFDDADGSLRLFLADPALEGLAPTLTQSEARSLFGRLRAVAEEAIGGRLVADLESEHADLWVCDRAGSPTSPGIPDPLLRLDCSPPEHEISRLARWRASRHLESNRTFGTSRGSIGFTCRAVVAMNSSLTLPA